ncbi:MAG: LytTR family transcriptional regulator [Clostridiales bacterium]|nr:LytTR family transcriptional regulator [Clostridiales bacterium]
MVCAAVFDTDQKRRNTLRSWITGYLIRSGRDMDLLWFSEPVSSRKLETYGRRIHLAFISLNDPVGAWTGRELYRQNPECRICYYQDEPASLEPLLSSRPIAFYLWKKGEDEFCDKLNDLMEELSAAQDIFCHETKREVFLIPYTQILYFQSDLKYVQIHTDHKVRDGRMIAKLSQIEARLDGRFIRIHKSYLVNRRFVEYVDKKEHMIILQNGESLPISDSCYESAMAVFREQ